MGNLRDKRVQRSKPGGSKPGGSKPSAYDQLRNKAREEQAKKNEAKRKKQLEQRKARKALESAKPGAMSAIKKGVYSPADLAKQSRKGPAKY